MIFAAPNTATAGHGYIHIAKCGVQTSTIACVYDFKDRYTRRHIHKYNYNYQHIDMDIIYVSTCKIHYMPFRADHQRTWACREDDLLAFYDLEGPSQHSCVAAWNSNHTWNGGPRRVKTLDPNLFYTGTFEFWIRAVFCSQHQKVLGWNNTSQIAVRGIMLQKKRGGVFPGCATGRMRPQRSMSLYSCQVCCIVSRWPRCFDHR